MNSYNNECDTVNLDKTVTNVVKLLERKGWTISTAESCTGGLLSELITSVSGYIGFDVGGRQFVRLPELWKLPDRSRDNIRRSAAAFVFETLESLLAEGETINE